ncbi:unnamed protein product [Spodoptera littoralis]|uniref:Homeobox domain-containing protein n=1 Tax=Spodoptera littoralis TaxID=7109 RepID=A0A9P0MW70_SPOLI|nr:unnamed protein product [Spodoptera littoralis]CAH1635626.1 unnamed protein product [Spodoptera littoralis]
MDHQLQELLQQGTAPVVVHTTQAQGRPHRLLDYHTWLGMQVDSRAQSQPATVTHRYPKRVRIRFATWQLNELESEYSNFRYVSETRRKQLADRLQLKEHTITVWFQNRRMREKKAIVEAQQLSQEVYREFQQPTLDYQRIAQTYPMEIAPLTQNYTSGQNNYSLYHNRLIVSPRNIQESPHHRDVDVLPQTQPVTPSIDSQKFTSLGSTREEIIKNLLLLERYYKTRHTDVAATTEEEMQSSKNVISHIHSPFLYDDTAPSVSFPKQHYPDEVEDLPVMERRLHAVEEPVQHIPTDLMDLPCDTFFKDVDINNYY